MSVSQILRPYRPTGIQFQNCRWQHVRDREGTYRGYKTARLLLQACSLLALRPIVSTMPLEKPYVPLRLFDYQQPAELVTVMRDALLGMPRPSRRRGLH